MMQPKDFEASADDGFAGPVNAGRTGRTPVPTSTRRKAMPAFRKQSQAPIYQLKVTLRDSKPPIWRRVQLPADITLHKLHRVLQTVMGWTDSHLHQFVVDGEIYGEPDPAFDLDVKSERRARLHQIVRGEKDKFIYEYDFGDGWEHVVLLEKVLPTEPGARYPVCLTGRRACPPEDVGGVWGYAEFLGTIGDETHPEHEEMLEWVGREFDPEHFDLEDTNAALRLLR